MKPEQPHLPERERYDVAILGGGLAGLSLGLQLKSTRPATNVLVVEKRAGPAPEAAHKVGESTDNFAAHYFGTILGMRDHMEEKQLLKGGVRMFFPAGDNSDITIRPEFGPWRPSPGETYQLDRGIFENELASRNKARKVDVFEGTAVKEIELADGDDDHVITLEQDGNPRTVRARWVVDAMGRGGQLRKKLGLDREVEHNINSAWIRLKGGIDIDEWSDDREWLDRTIVRGLRRTDTLHLVGRGYWVWMISLASGPISIGICADPRFHPYEEINELDAWIDWLNRHEPQLGAAVDARRDDVLDFLRIRRFAFGTQRLYSPQRWCLVGDAAMFSDALYSPGSDFIGIGNSFITDIVNRDLRGEDVAERIEFHNKFLLDLFDRFLSYYTDNYVLFGNPQVGGLKLAADFMVYWGEVALPFMRLDIGDLDAFREIEPAMRSTDEMLARSQQFYREWDALERREMPPIHRPTRGKSAAGERLLDLVHPIEPRDVPQRVKDNAKRFEALMVIAFHEVASRLLPDSPIDESTPINPFAIGLDPSKWEEDGLFGTPERPGMTLTQANELFYGFDEIFFRMPEEAAVGA